MKQSNVMDLLRNERGISILHNIFTNVMISEAFNNLIQRVVLPTSEIPGMISDSFPLVLTTNTS